MTTEWKINEDVIAQRRCRAEGERPILEMYTSYDRWNMEGDIALIQGEDGSTYYTRTEFIQQMEKTCEIRWYDHHAAHNGLNWD